MVQILFGLGVDAAKGSKMSDFFRKIFSVFDEVVYTLVGYIYKILFNIADSTIISSDMMKAFFSRVQLILGVIMIFKISVSLMQYVINPDSFSDKKTGFGQVITRFIVMLAMLTAIVPLNIPTSATQKNSYNSYLNQNGLLFGTLYSLQHRILKGNTLGKLILGTSRNTVTNNYGEEESSVDFTEDSNMGNAMAAYILKNFISINYKEKSPDSEDSVKDESSYMCAPNQKVKASSTDIKRRITVTAVSAGVGYAVGTVTSLVLPPPLGLVVGGFTAILTSEILSDENKIGYYYNAWINTDDPTVVSGLVNVRCSDGYAFAYFPIVSTICGLFLFITLAFSCLDVAIRALKLAILRLISPIAIISYIDPKSTEKGAFGNWVKMLVSTYLELFLRLAILYFVIFIVDSIIHGGIELPITQGLVGAFSTVIIIIGLFYFARQAPKFITDALGIKSMNMGVGLSGLLGATGALVGGAGLRGAAAGFMNASNQAADAAAQGKQAPSPWSTGSDLAAKIRTNDPNAKGGVTNWLQRRAMNNLANHRGHFDEANTNKKKFGDEAEAARQHINKLNGDISAEQSKLSSLKATQSTNDRNIQDTKDALTNNFSQNMRDKINELRRRGYSNGEIQTEFASKYGIEYENADFGQYFAMEDALKAYQKNAANIENQISASETIISNQQNELRLTEVYKGEMEFGKKKAEEALGKMEKIYGNVGNVAHDGDSVYGGPPGGISPSKNNRPWDE